MAASHATPTDQREINRVKRELGSQTSPLLKLPGEIRNAIYEYALPAEQVFHTVSKRDMKVKGVEENIKTSAISIQSRVAYQRHFGITQVCRQLRKETIKILYSSNIFMLRVVSHADDHGCLHGSGRWIFFHHEKCFRYVQPPSLARWRKSLHSAEVWLQTRAPEALQALSQVILQFWDPEEEGMEMVLFGSDLKTYKIISHADIGKCSPWEDREERRECPRCFEDKWRQHKFDDVLETTVRQVKTNGEPGDKLLKLVEVFRAEVQDNEWYWKHSS